ncbi:MAG: hypothetical protein AVO34_00230 [Firmicutes bacterium ML8_F2]|nr:MAG: hypothetical protein AVO34_00230 [Firmicutes bacterium ML8_F2]
MFNLKRWKMFLLPVLLVFVLGLALAGCGGEEAVDEEPVDEEPVDEEPVDEESGEDVEVITLDFASPFPEPHHQHVNVIEPWIEAIEEASNGRVEINFYPGGTLSESTAVVDDVATGAVDIGFTMLGYTPGRFPLTDMTRFPAHFQSMEEVTRTLNILLAENADFQEEWTGYKVFALYGLPEGNAYTNNAPIQGIADFDGRDLRVSGELEEDTIAALGGMGSLIPMPEVYDALERGVVDGLLTDNAAIDTYKLYEVLEYATSGMSMFYATKAIFMNEDTWNSLPADIQAIFDERSGLDLALKGSEIYAEAELRGIQKMEENGIEVYEWTEQDAADLLEVANPVVEGFLDQLEAGGLPAWDVYEHLLEARDSLR